MKTTLLISYVITLILYLPTTVSADIHRPLHDAIMKDSVGIMDEEEVADTTGKTRRNTAKEFNALEYIMEHRYRNYGDQFTKRWDDHLFIELGTGFSQDVAKVNGYAVSTVNNVHFAIGKQLSRVHTLRMTGGADFGYLKKAGNNYARINGKVDWLYNITTYLEGYNPSRLIDLSTMFGFGARYLFRPSQTTVKKLNPEMHVGLQFKFFTGPQAYLALEPFVGLGSTKVSQRYNSFYGIDINLIYYIHNNLSPEQRLRFMSKRPDGTEQLVPPSTWRTPWFLELGGGVAWNNGCELSTAKSLGHKFTGSVGRWLSPAIGLRANITMTTTTWNKDASQSYKFIGAEGKGDKTFEMNLHNQNMEGQIETLINPMGFLKNFRWDTPFGAALVAGGGVGWSVKHQQGVKLKVHAISYTAGIHLWAQLANDMQVFVEPRFTRYNYRVPYNNSTWARRFNDNQVNVNIGITTLFRSKHFRTQQKAKEEEFKHFSVGLGGGTSLIHSQQAYEQSTAMSYNGNIFAEYHFDHYQSVRASFEYLSRAGLGTQSIRVSDGFGNTFAGTKTAMFSFRHNLGIASIGYMVNISSLLSGRESKRRFEAEAFIGPAVFFHINSTQDLKSENILYDSQTYEYKKPGKAESCFAMNGGAKLKYHLAKHLSLALMPQIYVLRKAPHLGGISIDKFRFVETLDFGIQYNL